MSIVAKEASPLISWPAYASVFPFWPTYGSYEAKLLGSPQDSLANLWFGRVPTHGSIDILLLNLKRLVAAPWHFLSLLHGMGDYRAG
jgi:hypothetical protein